MVSSGMQSLPESRTIETQTERGEKKKKSRPPKIKLRMKKTPAAAEVFVERQLPPPPPPPAAPVAPILVEEAIPSNAPPARRDDNDPPPLVLNPVVPEREQAVVVDTPLPPPEIVHEPQLADIDMPAAVRDATNVPLPRAKVKPRVVKTKQFNHNPKRVENRLVPYNGVRDFKFHPDIPQPQELPSMVFDVPTPHALVTAPERVKPSQEDMMKKLWEAQYLHALDNLKNDHQSELLQQNEAMKAKYEE
jgi:hypothetical protein